MKLLEFLKSLEKPPSEQPELTTNEVLEAGAELLDVCLPAIDALGGLRRHCLDVGLSEDAANEIVMGVVRKMVEQM